MAAGDDSATTATTTEQATTSRILLLLLWASVLPITGIPSPAAEAPRATPAATTARLAIQRVPGAGDGIAVGVNARHGASQLLVAVSSYRRGELRLKARGEPNCRMSIFVCHYLLSDGTEKQPLPKIHR